MTIAFGCNLSRSKLRILRVTSNLSFTNIKKQIDNTIQFSIKFIQDFITFHMEILKISGEFLHVGHFYDRLPSCIVYKIFLISFAISQMQILWDSIVLIPFSIAYSALKFHWVSFYSVASHFTVGFSFDRYLSGISNHCWHQSMHSCLLRQWKFSSWLFNTSNCVYLVKVAY